MNRIEFENRIEKLFDQAWQNGLNYKTIIAGDLHEKVGCYPSPNNRMPTCCDVMKKKMKAGDVIVESPPSGYGASLKIKYKL